METNPFLFVKPWMEGILQSIRKEIRRDHLGSDHQFRKTHFGANSPMKILFEEIVRVYTQELLQGNEALVAWVINAWVFRHGDLYKHFSERLSEVNPNFSELTSLTTSQLTFQENAQTN